MTDPAPTKPSSSITTGATRVLFEPTKNAIPKSGGVLVSTIVIAGNRARTDIGASADIGITQIGQMIRLTALTHLCIFSFNKIAHFAGWV